MRTPVRGWARNYLGDDEVQGLAIARHERVVQRLAYVRQVMQQGFANHRLRPGPRGRRSDYLGNLADARLSPSIFDHLEDGRKGHLASHDRRVTRGGLAKAVLLLIVAAGVQERQER